MEKPTEYDPMLEMAELCVKKVGNGWWIVYGDGKYLGPYFSSEQAWEIALKQDD